MRVIDGFVNPVFWSAEEAPGYVPEALNQTFQTTLGAKRPETPEELVAEMDAVGVDHAIVSAVDGFWDRVHAYVEARPDRFSFSVEVNPRGGMETVRQVERAVRDYGAILIRIVPFVVGLPPSDPIYYPVFAKCIELDVPVAMNAGIPVPKMPAAPQQPIHLDEVLRFLPELKVVMQHGADPWWGEAIRFLLKYENLYMMTSAWAPKHLPAELVHFMNTRGRRKVMWASDWPALPFDRCLREAKEMPLRPGVLEEYLSETALGLWPELAGDAVPGR